MNLADMNGAILSPCQRYRYRLWRYWQPEKPPMCFVMLNPSTADDTVNDQTITKCIGFATRHGAGGIEVVNLFAWRSRDPMALRYLEASTSRDPIGADNDAAIRAAVQTTLERLGFVVFAWGANARYHRERELATIAMLREAFPYAPFHALEITAHGHPGHPCMLPYASPLQEFPL